MSKLHRGLCMSFYMTDLGFCRYQSFVWSNLHFLHISEWITLPTRSCLVLYSFCANLLYLLIMRLIVSSLSRQNQHSQFCCVLSILHLIWLVLMALLGPAIWRNLVSLLRFLFLSHVHVFLSEISFVSRLKCPQSYFSFHFRFQVISGMLVSCCEYCFWWL